MLLARTSNNIISAFFKHLFSKVCGASKIYEVAKDLRDPISLTKRSKEKKRITYVGDVSGIGFHTKLRIPPIRAKTKPTMKSLPTRRLMTENTMTRIDPTCTLFGVSLLIITAPTIMSIPVTKPSAASAIIS